MNHKECYGKCERCVWFKNGGCSEWNGMKEGLTMSEKKKKCYIVKCEVNMDASHYETVIVKTTKPHLACQKAEAELKNNGFFHVIPVSCNEMGG